MKLDKFWLFYNMNIGLVVPNGIDVIALKNLLRGKTLPLFVYPEVPASSHTGRWRVCYLFFAGQLFCLLYCNAQSCHNIVLFGFLIMLPFWRSRIPLCWRSAIRDERHLRGKVCGKLRVCCTAFSVIWSLNGLFLCRHALHPGSLLGQPVPSLLSHSAHRGVGAFWSCATWFHLLACWLSLCIDMVLTYSVILRSLHLPGCLWIAWSSTTSLLNTVYRATRQKYVPKATSSIPVLSPQTIKHYSSKTL